MEPLPTSQVQIPRVCDASKSNVVLPLLQPGYELEPFVTYSQQTAPGGVWNFPPAGETPFVLLNGAVVYLNITASDCQQVTHL